jgi:hypothetical protein
MLSSKEQYDVTTVASLLLSSDVTLNTFAVGSRELISFAETKSLNLFAKEFSAPPHQAGGSIVLWMPLVHTSSP